MTRTATVDEYRAEAARSMSERKLQEHVRQLAKSVNALYYHTHRSQHSPSGFPDVVILTGDARLIVAELKRENAIPTEAQENWLEALRLTFDIAPEWFSVHVWRPSNWLSGEIEAIVKGEES